jgi:hypothetical protein
MVRFRKSVTIQADPDAVFALVADVARKAHLNPGTEVIRVEQETDGPVGKQTVFHFVLRHGVQIIDYRSRCVAFKAGRIMETVSFTEPSFSVRVTVEPGPDGACLTQEEWFDLKPPPRARAPRQGLVGLLTNLAVGIFGEPASPRGALRQADEAKIQAQLETRLAQWLQAIKAHLEGERSRERGL